jgi:mono/diheme cytochrome c family protein
MHCRPVHRFGSRRKPAWDLRWRLRFGLNPPLLNAVNQRVTPRFLCALSLGLICLPSFGPARSSAAETVRFNRDIRPIFSDHCLQCHGPDDKQRKAKLRLDTKKGLFAARDDGVVVRPGKPAESELIRRVTASNPDDHMPPPEVKKPLSPEEIARLRAWIEQGAEWQDHWAFIPPETPALPAVTDASWPVNPIDRFVLARLEKAGLQPNPEADRRTLIRRVTYDLTGLPPNPSAVEAFVRDSHPDAYEKVVDRLLASERYGERMALAWMDAARYGDSSVHHADGVRFMWPWRDWVINAYNANMPFDQFTIEQLAGDLLPGATLEQKVASGFNRNHATTDEGGAIDEEYRVEYVVDRVKTTSTVWLGLTMECGQCHDHKYDPISQKEYYAFYAYFNQTKDAGMQTRNGNAPPLVYLFTPKQEKELTQLEHQVADLEKQQRETKPDPAQVKTWVQSQRDHPEPEPPGAGLWSKLGPFPAHDANEAFAKDFGPEKELDLQKSYGDKKWEAQKDYKDGAVVSLGLPDNAAVYLYRTLTVSRAASYAVSLGSDDGLKVWLNGKELLAKNVGRGAAPDQDKVTLELEAGENRFLLKVNNGGGASGFYFKILGSSLPKDIRDLFSMADADWNPKQRGQLDDYYAKNIWPEAKERLAQIKAGQAREKSLRDSVPTCMVMEDMESPRKTYVLHRGNYASPLTNEVIRPGVPAVLPPMPAGAPGNRLSLARWLVDPRHPLTSRVTVNRYWEMLFGTGIVATESDFGTRGEWPSHPELLDWLARDFVDQGWNVKRTLKQMVMSATYRQSSRIPREKLEKDPQNRLLSRAPRLRLQGEFIRDTALALGGVLNEQVGGPSVKPYQPTGIWNEVSLDGNLKYDPDHGAKLYRRSMYTYWKRSAPSPSMMAFDAPTREKCVVKRQRTNTPLQALVTLNDVQFVEAARLFAERIIKEGGAGVADRINYALELAAGRKADVTRQDSLQSLYHRQASLFHQHPERAEALLAFGEYPRDKQLDAAELAAWTTVASVVMNLDEVLTKE